MFYRDKPDLFLLGVDTCVKVAAERHRRGKNSNRKTFSDIEMESLTQIRKKAGLLEVFREFKISEMAGEAV